MLKKLFQKNRQPTQIVGAATGAFLGLFLLLFASQVYFDFQAILRGGSENDSYMTINKPVSLVNTFLGKSVFSTDNIKEIEKETATWGTEGVAAFTANRFKVSASSRLIGFYTELFFESVPEPFLDIQDPAFRWHEDMTEVPIIMSKDYLALYNFGFALSQGLPQFTPETIRRVTVEITINGKGKQQTFSGRIIGFSERINSILVPERFMAFANDNFGEQPDIGASRLLMKVKNPYDKNLRQFLNEKGYEISSGRLIGGRLTTILNTVISSVFILGALLMLLSVLVFILNYQLIISKSASDIKLLLEIGYRPLQIVKVLRGSLMRLLGFVFLAVILALILARWGIVTLLNQQGFELNHYYHIIVIAGGLVLMFLITVANYANIQKNVG